jgi:hypothetical protein
VTMIQHDQQSRWKMWMRLLAVDIRPISHEHVTKVEFSFDRLPNVRVSFPATGHRVRCQRSGS